MYHRFPQSRQRSVITNTNFPPQGAGEHTNLGGGSMEYENFVIMEFEDLEDMEYEA